MMEDLIIITLLDPLVSQLIPFPDYASFNIHV
jgi:hypothetical protein